MKMTPMMQQYFEVKERYPEAILFFRMGDFYEMFFEDAVVGARALGADADEPQQGSGGRGPDGGRAAPRGAVVRGAADRPGLLGRHL